MSLPKLTKSRLKGLKAIHGWQLVATVPKHALRLLARTDVAIEKLTNTPKWRAGRIALQRFRIHRGPRPKQRIPNNGYRSAKVGHWLKDHSRRIKDMAEDAVCAAATGFGDYQSPAEAIAAFNDHITPIAELYGFKLHVDGEGVLRGDIGKALSVLTYLCSSQRTREIDWLLDMVTVMTQDQPFQWEGAWKRKLRHTKRGAWWRARRERRERQQAIAVTKERQRELDRAALNETIQDGGVYSNAPHSHIAATPTMAEQEGDVAGDLKRLLGHEQYYPWRWGERETEGITMNEFENVCAGIFLALLTALDREATERAVETLFAFVADPGTPQYERKFYADLAESVEMARLPRLTDAFDIDQLVTLH